jgi:hypothetical protein
MAQTPQLASLERVATALGVSPSTKELSMLSVLIGGLSSISVKDASITIRIPEHLVRADVELTLKDIGGIALSGDARTIIVTRADKAVESTPPSLTELRLPPPPARSPDTLKPELLDPRVRNRASQLLETLEMSLAEAPNYLGVIAVLEKVSSFTIRETKNTRSDGCIFISAETQDDARSLLEGLGFTRASTTSGNLWAGLSYQRICHRSETKASASIAHTARGCDISIEYGEPLADSRTIIREYSAMASTRLVD